MFIAKSPVRWTVRAGRASLEILAVLIGILSLIGIATNAGAEVADVYKCLCNNGPYTSADIYGHQECQHGPEQDPDCVWYEINYATGFGSGCGKASPVPNPIPQNLKDRLIALGYDPAVVNNAAALAALFDGQCKCFDCVYNTTQTVAGNTQNSPCEALIIHYGAYCQRDQTGTCDLNPPVNGVRRESKAGALKPGKTTCSGLGGATNGPKLISFCGRGAYTTDGTQIGSTHNGTACLDDGSNCTSGATRNQVQGQIATCKTP